MPSYTRPREKALRYGVDTLSDQELLAIIIGSGTRDNNVLDLSNKLLLDFGGLYNLSKANSASLIRYNGLGKVKCITLLTMFSLMKRINTYKIEEENIKEITVEIIGEKYLHKIANKDQEFLALVVVNRNKKISYETILSLGEQNVMNLSKRELIKLVYSHNGYGYYLIHNHPSGIARPSLSDIAFTEALSKYSQKARIKLIDHIIIGENSYFPIIETMKKREKYCL